MTREQIAKRIETMPLGHFAMLMGFVDDHKHVDEIVDARKTIVAALRMREQRDYWNGVAARQRAKIEVMRCVITDMYREAFKHLHPDTAANAKEFVNEQQTTPPPFTPCRRTPCRFPDCSCSGQQDYIRDPDKMLTATEQLPPRTCTWPECDKPTGSDYCHPDCVDGLIPRQQINEQSTSEELTAEEKKMYRQQMMDAVRNGDT